MNYKPGFKLRGEEKLCTNAQVFATHDEAKASAHSRFMVWTMPEDYGVVETEDPVNYRWDEKLGDVHVES